MVQPVVLLRRHRGGLLCYSARPILFKIGRSGTTRKPVRERRGSKGNGQAPHWLKSADERPIAASDERHDHIRKSGPKPAKGREENKRATGWGVQI